MLSMNKLVLSPLVRVFLFAIATMFAATNFADDGKQPLQLAALSDGFDAEQTYMMSCFACHSTGAAGDIESVECSFSCVSSLRRDPNDLSAIMMFRMSLERAVVVR